MPEAKQQRTLVEFVTMKRREGCKVCAFPDDIRAQVRAARTKKIDRRIVLEWLRTDCKLVVTEADMTTHSNGHHE